MTACIEIGGRRVGDGEPCYVIAELGINHDGSMRRARELVDIAALAGCDAVKTQKRTIGAVYTPEELAVPLPDGAPNGWRTRGDYVRARELSVDQHWELATYAAQKGLHYTASAWDMQAVEDVEALSPAFHKIASAMLTHDRMLDAIRETGRPVIMSTGGSTLEQVDRAVERLRGSPLALLHCVSTYPANDDDLNLRAIETLRSRYGVPVGYSGHERGPAMSLCARVLGACIIERHITYDRTAWGSDHAASLEVDGIRRLVRDVRAWERARGDGVKRVGHAEEAVMKRLRRER